jgi:hypothetical protein
MKTLSSLDFLSIDISFEVIHLVLIEISASAFGEFFMVPILEDSRFVWFLRTNPPSATFVLKCHLCHLVARGRMKVKNEKKIATHPSVYGQTNIVGNVPRGRNGIIDPPTAYLMPATWKWMPRGIKNVDSLLCHMPDFQSLSIPTK